MEIVRIAGIDPGLRFCGYGIINYNTETNEIFTSNCGLLKNKCSRDLKGLDAIMHMKSLIQNLKDDYSFSDCDSVVVEVPAAIYSKNFSSGSLIPVGVIAGILMGTLQDSNVIPVYPSVWNSSKKKDVTRREVESVLGPYNEWNYDVVPTAKPQFEHIIDAISMAFWYLKSFYMDE